LFFEIGLEDPNAIFEIPKVMELEIYPNPMSDFAVLKLEGLDVETIRITDLQGRVGRKILVENQEEIRIEKGKLEVGVYLITAFSKNGETIGNAKLTILD